MTRARGRGGRADVTTASGPCGPIVAVRAVRRRRLPLLWGAGAAAWSGCICREVRTRRGRGRTILGRRGRLHCVPGGSGETDLLYLSYCVLNCSDSYEKKATAKASAHANVLNLCGH